MDGEKQDITIGRPQESTPTPESASAPTVAQSKPVQPKVASANIRVALILALLQTDFSDLQSKGLRVAILAKDGVLYASVTYQDHQIGFEHGEITLDGANVSEV